MFGFHTPQLPDPLNLDLSTLSGGGSCPSQFYGKTHDQFDVYVRYRGGSLRVHIANEQGANALREGECVLEADIGPPNDGSMSLAQFCTYFGVTINGAVPTETDSQAHRYKNLTGQTTYWNANIAPVTDETSRKVVANAWSVFPDALLLKPITNDKFKLERLELTVPAKIDCMNVWLIDGASLLTDIDASPEDYVLAKPGQLQISIGFSSWRYPEPKYTSRLAELAEKELGQSLVIAGERNMPKQIALAHDHLNLSTSFPKADHEKRVALERLGKEIDRLLPMTKLERINLATRETESYLDQPLDPVITEWCNADENRWLTVLRDSRNGPWIGVRPANS